MVTPDSQPIISTWVVVRALGMMWWDCMPPCVSVRLPRPPPPHAYPARCARAPFVQRKGQEQKGRNCLYEAARRISRMSDLHGRNDSPSHLPVHTPLAMLAPLSSNERGRQLRRREFVFTMLCHGNSRHRTARELRPICVAPIDANQSGALMPLHLG